MALVEIKHLKKYYNTPRGLLHAIDDVTMDIEKGKTIGIVGESGCGKSTLGKTLIRMEDATDGEVYFDGKEVTHMSQHEFKNMRMRMQMIFQDPYASLDPRMSVSQLIAEPIQTYHLAKNKKELDEMVFQLMEEVGLAKRLANSYPHELDGGRRQRIGIARALSLNPEFIVCDEPVSALDVSIQAQILNLLRSLQKDLGLTCMFVGHGLGAVNYVSDRIAVMYLGKIVEIGPAQEVFHHPVHPYTRALIDAVPIADPKKREQKPLLTGEIGSSTNPPSGCRFHPRCPYATESCRQEVPELCSVFPGSSHLAACPYAIAQLTGGAPAYDAKMQQVVVEQKWR